MKKRVLALFLCFTMIFSLIPGQALAQEAGDSTEGTQATEPEVTEPEATKPEETEPEVTESTEESSPADEPSAQSDLPGGSCGDSATWTFDESTGLLTISGSGAMYDYEFSPDVAPWPGYSVKKVVIEPGITRIGNYAFVNRYNMTDVSIPDTVTSIGIQAFSGCDKLTVVLLPDGLTSIGMQAFLNCKNLVRITIPEGVTSISEKAFSGCRSMQVATLLGNVTSIGNSAFSNCSALTAINIPNSVTTIGAGSFSSCASLASINLSNSVTSIGDSAFHSCTALKEIILPDSVSSLGYTAFASCTALESVSLPASLTSLNSNTFQSCTNLLRVYIPKSITVINSRFSNSNALAEIFYGGSIEDWAKVDQGTLPSNAAVFYNCTGLGDPDIPRGKCGSTCAWSFDPYTGKLTIEGTYSTYTFTQDSDSSGKEVPWKDYLGQILSVEVQGVSGIGAYAFADAVNLASITMDSVTYIGDCAFRDCVSLKSVSLSDSLNNLRSYAFAGSGITQFSVPENVRSLSGTFQDCSALQAVYIPTNTRSIESSTFQNCPSLTDIYYAGYESDWTGAFSGTLSDQVTVHYRSTALDMPGTPGILTGECGYSATWTFDEATGLLTISGSGKIFDFGRLTDSQGIETGETRDVPWKSFLTEIKIVRIGDGITYIGNEAFNGAVNLTDVYAPTVTSVGKRAFYKAASLKTADIPGLRAIDAYAFSGCKALTSLPLPDNFSWFKDYAFQECGFTEYTLPGKVTGMPFLFEGCADLKAVFIPASVKSIGNTTFWDCTSLTDIYYEGSQEDWAAIYYPIKGPDEYNNATIHYNCTGLGAPEEPEEPKILREVRYFLDWEEQTQRAFFGPDGLVSDSCAVSEETDSAFLEDPTKYQGEYVLVETKMVGDEEILISMIMPDSRTGIVSAISSGGITIGDAVFPMTGGIEALEVYLGKNVLYHVFNDELIGIEVLQKKTGYLTYWHEAAGHLWIQSSETSTDSKQYRIGFSFPIENTQFLRLGTDVKNHLNVTVNYLVDSNRCIYEITPCIERRADGFSSEKHGWPIINGNIPLGYDTSTPIVLGLTTYFAAGINWKSFDAGLRNEFHDFTQEGVCFGYSLLAIAQYYNDTNPSKPHVNLRSYFSNTGSTLNEYGYDSIATIGSHSQYVLYHTDSNGAKVPMSDVVALIEKAQHSQFCSEFYYGTRNTAKFIGEKDFDDLIEYLNGDDPEPLLAVVKYTNTSTGLVDNHAVVVDTSYKPVYIGSGRYIIYIYNCNTPTLSNPLSQPAIEYTVSQSTLLIDTYEKTWYYGYAGDAKYGIGQTNQQDEYNICFHDVSEMSYSFFRDYYENPLEFDRERISLIFEYGMTDILLADNLPFLVAYRDDPETEERQKVFEIHDGEPTFYIDNCGYTAYAAGSGSGPSNLGMLTLPKGRYYIQVNTDANLQCMYRENIFTYGGNGNIELVIDYAADSATVLTHESPATMSLVFAGADVAYSSIVGVEMKRNTSVTMSANSANYSTTVSTNAPAESITLQHAVDGELIDITPDMIHQHKDLVHNKAAEATCTADGQAEHYLCSCGKTFAGEDAYEEITDVVIPALGHIGQWAPTGNTEGEEYRVCERCGEKEIRMAGSLLVMDPEVLGDHSSVWIDGLIYPVQTENGKSIIQLPEGDAFYMQTYTFHIGDESDVHTQYPTSMQVWKVEKNAEGVFTAQRIEELDDLLQYSGSSIRITGNKGIRMITSITKGNKSALTGEGLAGFTLEEYGTALCWATDLAPGEDLVLGKDYTRSNYAYKKGVADPIFAQTDTLIQYTNVLVGFDDDQCIPDIAMRPYIILSDAEGNQVTLYGGTVYRSIGYIAWQNRTVFKPGSASYDFVWGIIHHVYGDIYDADYQN